MKKVVLVSIFLLNVKAYAEEQKQDEKELFVSSEALESADKDLKEGILKNQVQLKPIDRKTVFKGPSSEVSRDSFMKEQIEKHLEETYPKHALDTRAQQNRALDTIGLKLKKYAKLKP